MKREHRPQLGDDRRLARRQPLTQRRRHLGGTVRVVDVVYRQGGRAVADGLADPIDHRLRRVTDGAHPLGQNKFAVVDTQQRLERQRGARPRHRPPDASAAAQVVQSMHHDERMSACHGRARGVRDGVQVTARGRCPRRGHSDEAGAHRGRLGVDDPHVGIQVGRRCVRRPGRCPTAPDEMCTASTPSAPLSANACWYASASSAGVAAAVVAASL